MIANFFALVLGVIWDLAILLSLVHSCLICSSILSLRACSTLSKPRMVLSSLSRVQRLCMDKFLGLSFNSVLRAGTHLSHEFLEFDVIHVIDHINGR